LQKLRQRELTEKWAKEERDWWFNQARPMIKPKKMWREKRLAREEGNTDNSDNPDEFEVGESNGTKMGEVVDTGVTLDINMVFLIPEEFQEPNDNGVAQLCIGAEQAVFEKLAKVGEHMKPLYIKGHLDDTPIGRMMVDGGASFNIMLVTVFEKLGHTEGDVKQTCMNLSGFSAKPIEAKGIIFKELILTHIPLTNATISDDRYNRR
jgi:hypothetical protein